MNTTPTPSNFITSGPLLKGILQLAVPSMVSMVSIMLFEFVDLLWIGKLGADAVAALGAASFVVWAVKSIASCVTAGLNALVARNTGTGDKQRAKMWASQGMMLTILFSLFISGIVLVVNIQLFHLLGLAVNVAQMAQQYTLIMALGLSAIFIMLSLDNIFRASGNTFIPMIAMVVSLALNAFLDPVFMFGWFGVPAYGMPGGAIASVIAHVIGCFILVWKLKIVHIRLRCDMLDFIIHCKEILRIGTPIGLLGAVFSAIYIILSKNIAYFGTVPMAAISICHRIEGVPFFVAFGFSMAVATFVGQNLGADKPNRAAKGAYLSLTYVAIFLLITSVIFIIWGKHLLGFFIDDQAVINEGYNYLFAISIFEVFLAAEIVLEGAFTGAGDTKPPFLISIPLTFLRIPFGYLFSIHLGYGVKALWWVIAVTTFLKGTMFFLWFLRGKWKTVKIG